MIDGLLAGFGKFSLPGYSLLLLLRGFSAGYVDHVAVCLPSNTSVSLWNLWPGCLFGGASASGISPRWVVLGGYCFGPLFWVKSGGCATRPHAFVAVEILLFLPPGPGLIRVTLLGGLLLWEPFYILLFALLLVTPSGCVSLGNLFLAVVWLGPPIGVFVGILSCGE